MQDAAYCATGQAAESTSEEEIVAFIQESAFYILVFLLTKI